MADKAEKIAAARKKLKQYQSKQKQDSVPRGSEPSSARETPVPAQSSSSSSCFSDPPAAHVHEDIQNQNHLPASSGPSSYGGPAVASYFNNGGGHGVADFFAMEPQVARPDVPQMEASVHSINRISDGIGQLIANASADLGPQNTILELESEKAELARTLNAQKLENDELRLRLRNNQSTVEELRNEIDKLRVENSTKVTSELGPIQEQLQMQTQAVGVMVGEKAELMGTVSKLQSLVKERANENDELQNRLKASRATVQKLEKELESMKQSGSRFESLERTIGVQLNEFQEEANKFRKLYEDLQEDLGEHKQKLLVRNQEFQTVQKELEQTRSDLSLAKLRIEQLSSDDDLDFNAKIEALTQQNLIKAQQIKDLQEIIKQIGAERDQSNQQYQNYVLHLNKEVTNLADKIRELTEENNDLSSREGDLVRHVGELERQMQQQLSKEKKYAAQQQEEDKQSEADGRQALEAEVKLLKEKVATMEVERAEYMKQNESVELLKRGYEDGLKARDEQIASLQLTVERLQQDKPDVARLMAEIDSGKVGASRAVAQNMELKAQLEEMQKAFVQISNDKLELTEKLQTELHLGKEMKSTYGQLETELHSIREKLHYKDEEMIRLAHENTELNKQLLQQNQEIDRLRYYESRASDGNVLQLELQRAQQQLEQMQRSDHGENECDGHGHDTHDHHHHHQHHHHHEESNAGHDQTDLHREIDVLQQEKAELVKVINNFQARAKASPGHENHADQPPLEASETMSTVSIPTHEAMEKLQERFRRTILEVAELTDEKQRLEHLVLQLQGETETIGEYITLYQQQRRLLKQKDMERDHQLLQLANDREMMKLKLKELNYLVHQLVAEKGPPRHDHDHQNHHHETANTPLVDLPTPSPPLSENGDNGKPAVHIRPTETAGRILSLLTDIKEANIPYGSGVQHCSCCSGRLETV